MSRRGVIYGVLVLSIGVVGLVSHEVVTYPRTARQGTGTAREVTIVKGMSFPAVADHLVAAEVIDSALYFRMYGMYRGLATQIRSGTYSLSDDLTPEQVLEQLVRGVPDPSVSVTLREGLNMLEVFDAIAAAKVAPREALERLARDRDYLDSHGISADSIEGYLFPETYSFRMPSGPRVVLDTLVRQHKIVWEQIRISHKKQLNALKKKTGWSDHDVVIMASIVEKEAVLERERATIAQVFINRLLSKRFRPKLLQTDPSIRYGCTVPVTKSAPCHDWKPTDRLRRAQLDDEDNPYNTYQHVGLPPGPIGNPGESSLRATVDPDGSKYFFFVSKNDGSHVFARTVREHNRNVNKYQR